MGRRGKGHASGGGLGTRRGADAGRGLSAERTEHQRPWQDGDSAVDEPVGRREAARLGSGDMWIQGAHDETSRDEPRTALQISQSLRICRLQFRGTAGHHPTAHS